VKPPIPVSGWYSTWIPRVRSIRPSSRSHVFLLCCLPPRRMWKIPRRRLQTGLRRRDGKDGI